MQKEAFSHLSCTTEDTKHKSGVCVLCDSVLHTMVFIPPDPHGIDAHDSEYLSGCRSLGSAIAHQGTRSVSQFLFTRLDGPSGRELAFA